MFEFNTNFNFIYFLANLGSILVWKQLLGKLKPYTEQSGYEYLNELIESVDSYDTAFRKHDLPAIAELYIQSIKLLRELARHLNNEKYATRISFVADECEKVLKKLKAKGASLKDIVEFTIVSTSKMRDEL